jgi:hypothetical protein
MKRTYLLGMVGFLLLCPAAGAAGPVRISEVHGVHSTAWTIELCADMATSLDGWYIEGAYGTAYFRSGMFLQAGEYRVVTPDSFLSSLFLRIEDDLRLCSPQGISSRLSWGMGYFSGIRGMVCSPYHGESICWNQSGSFYYLDRTPTPGVPNDSAGAIGNVHGTLAAGSVNGIQVRYGPDPDDYVLSDSTGHFMLHDFARLRTFRIVDPRYDTVVDTMQVWPDSSLTVLYILSLITPMTYPLHIGDLWNWGQAVARVVGDTLMTNGKRYAVLDDPLYTQFRFQRFEGNRVYEFDWFRDGEVLVFDFTRPGGTTIATYIDGDDTTDFTMQWVGQSDMFGRVRRQWGIWRDTRNWWDDEVYWEVTDSIGVTLVEGMWFYDSLDGAVINGRVFGVVNAVTDGHQAGPAQFSLSQNYPNPFNPTTDIGFRITDYGWVTLRVYDVLGREVATLVDEVKNPGTYTIRWDASADASGVYFYRLTAGTAVQTRKMALIR